MCALWGQNPLWFYNPQNVHSYPNDWHPLLIAAKAMLPNEAAQLNGYAIPVPTVRTDSAKARLDITFEPRLDTNKNLFLGIGIPQFILPPHLLYRCRHPKPQMEPRQQLGQDVYYFLSGKAGMLDRAKTELQTHGLAAVAQAYNGRWFNRDPYELYRYLNQTYYFFTNDPARLFRNGEGFPIGHSQQLSAWPVFPPLEQVTGFSVDELQAMEQRLTLYSGLTAEILPQSSLLDVLTQQTRDIPDGILLDIPLPDRTFAEHPITLKVLPAGEVKRGLAQQFLDGLRRVKKPVAFEVVSAKGSIYFQLSFAPADRPLIERQVALFFEGSVTIECSGSLPETTSPLYLSTEQPANLFRMSRTLGDFAIDPYHHLFFILSETNSTDTVCAQILFVPLASDAITKATVHLENHFVDDKKTAVSRIRELERKLPPWLATVRLISSKPGVLAKLHAGFVSQYETHDQTWNVSEVETIRELDRKATAWTILSTEELAALAHFPGDSLQCDRLERASMKSKLPPPLFTTGEVTLGISEVRGETKTVTLPDQVRDKHLYIVGKTGMGKSTLLFNLALQDIQRGAGVAVIDPHGDLVEELLTHIPRERVNDVIYFDAADRKHPIALNILETTGDEEIGRLADDLLTTFKRLSKDTGDKMEYVLTMTFYTLLSVPGSTFLDIESILSDSEFRERVVSKLTSPRLIRFWQQQFHGLRDAVQPILTRMSKFSMSPTINALLSQPGSALNFYDVIQGRKILLVNLASGKIGEHSSILLGSLLVSQLQLAVMRRAYLAKGARHPYYLYVDEFQNFTSTAFEKILSEARKYQLCLTLAHQFVSQLEDSQRKAIFGNVGTAIMFSLGAEDANALRYQIGSYEPTDLINLPEFEALCRPATSVADTFNFMTLPPPAREHGFAGDIIEHTHKTYGATSRPTVDAPPSQTTPIPAPTLPPVKAEPLPIAHASVAKGKIQQPKVTRKEGATAGRGGQQHKYLQQLIKRLAEAKGYRAVIEQQILGGVGSVDVSLEKDELKIACEISVTSTGEQELKNIQKCLAAGYDKVILLASDKKLLAKLQRAVEGQLESEVRDNVLFLLPEEFLTYLEQTEAEGSNKEETVRGYKVKVQYTAVTESEKQARKQAISQVILQALRRMKPPD